MKVNKYEQYEHHDKVVWTRTATKGKHWKFCLCHSCELLKIGQPNNCPIARKLYGLCIEENLVTPVFECPKFQKKVEKRVIGPRKKK